MLKKLFLIFWIFVSTLGWTIVLAQSKPTLLRDVPKFALVDEVIELQPKEKHHFNLKAPQKCGEFAFIKKTEQLLICKPTKIGQLTVRLSICDDEKTFCKVETFSINIRRP